MALGAAIGLAALTRQDSLLLLPFAALPATVLAGGAAGRVIGRCALTAAVAAAVVTPWVVRNAIRVHETAIATTSAASALAGANCRQSYNGPAIGYWVGGCARFEAGQRTSEAHFSRTIRDDAITYARAHADRLPVVLSARFARVWGLWDPFDQAWREKVESREYRWQELVWPASLATLLLGLAGLRMLARHGRPIAMLVVPLVTTTVIALLGYGNTRFRAPAECTLAVGAAAVLLALWERRSSGPSRAAVHAVHDSPGVTGDGLGGQRLGER